VTSLRPYQRAAIDAVFKYWQEGEAGNPLLDLATGTGKSVVLATLMRELMQGYPLMRMLVLVHVRELVSQNFQQLLRAWPQAPAGINSAGLGRRDTSHPIIFASIQSVYKNPERLGRRDLVLIDEAHLTPPDGDGMYMALLKGLKERSPDIRVMGCTATPYRLSSGRLDQGSPRFFDRIVYSYGIADGVADGFLSPLVAKGMKSEIDVKGVAKSGGEFKSGALELAADKAELVAAAVTEIISYGQARRSWLIFCSGVDHAIHVCAELRSRGVVAEYVTGTTSKGERDRILNGFKAGVIKAVCNMSVLTTGFDAPNTDLIAMLRPTLSTGLYVQMLGRGTRIAPKKTDCLVLDFSGNVRRHGPVDMIDVEAKTRGPKGETLEAAKVDSVRAKECPSCQTLNPMAVRHCLTCDYEFPVAAKHEAKADTEVSVMSGKDRDGFVPVKSVHYYRHEKRDNLEALPTLRVEYGVGIDSLRAWYCFSHAVGSTPYKKALQWWLEAGGQIPVPQSVNDALARVGELNAPISVLWRKVDGGFKEIVARRYGPQQLKLEGVAA
jgi:DNA repair protein RadD